jgi:hypothetical protein
MIQENAQRRLPIAHFPPILPPGWMGVLHLQKDTMTEHAPLRLHLPLADPATPGLLGGSAYSQAASHAFGHAYHEAMQREHPHLHHWFHSAYIVSRLTQRPELSAVDTRFTASGKVRAVLAVRRDGKAWQQVARELRCPTSWLKRWEQVILALVRRFYLPDEEGGWLTPR